MEKDRRVRKYNALSITRKYDYEIIDSMRKKTHRLMTIPRWNVHDRREHGLNSMILFSVFYVSTFVFLFRISVEKPEFAKKRM